MLLFLFGSNLLATNLPHPNTSHSIRHKYVINMLSPPVLGGKWRLSDHAPASCTGPSFFVPGFRPYAGQDEEGVPEVDYSWICLVSPRSALHPTKVSFFLNLPNLAFMHRCKQRAFSVFVNFSLHVKTFCS